VWLKLTIFLLQWLAADICAVCYFRCYAKFQLHAARDITQNDFILSVESLGHHSLMEVTFMECPMHATHAPDHQ